MRRSTGSASKAGTTTARSGSSRAAAPLSDEASAGQILLSQRAQAALEGRVEANQVAELQMKGFARPVPAYELVRIVDEVGGT
jgi:class 3 adenylate cyclase